LAGTLPPIDPPEPPNLASEGAILEGVLNVLMCMRTGVCPKCGGHVPIQPVAREWAQVGIAQAAYGCASCHFTITSEEFSNAIGECLKVMQDDVEAWEAWREAFHNSKL
jgi:hypothetical protein